MKLGHVASQAPKSDADTVFGRFQELARRSPEAVALILPTGDSVTYQELLSHAVGIARKLGQANQTIPPLVLVPARKTLVFYASVLAVVSLGSAFAPVDMGAPRRRLKQLAQETGALLALALDPEDSAAFKGILDVVLVSLPTEDSWLDEAEGIRPRALPGDPIYVIFTSGSTGAPKAPVMSHHNLLTFVAWARDEFGISPGTKVSGLNAPYFDNSIFDFFVPILNGATAVQFSMEDNRDLLLAPARLRDTECEIWFAVPSLYVYWLNIGVLSKEVTSKARLIMFGGEGFPTAKLRQLRELTYSSTLLVNIYGPSECTCMCSAYIVQDDDLMRSDAYPPVGYLSATFRGNLMEIEDGFGELVLYGPQVGMGYWNDPNLTNLRFKPNPANPVWPEVGYWTGDIFKKDEQGRLVFVSRLDDLVKVRGHRVSLLEIEATAMKVQGVSEAVAALSQKGDLTNLALAYSGDVSPSEIGKFLRERLPSYMVPTEIRKLDLLPRNRNGKISRKITAEEFLSDV